MDNPLGVDMKPLLLGLFVSLGVLGQSPVLFQQPLSPRIANYWIDVAYDPATKLVEGQQRLLWFNTGGQPVTELRFHLYLNAFRNSETTFMREASRNTRYPGRGSIRSPEPWGFIDIQRMAVAAADESADPMAVGSFTGVTNTVTPDLRFDQPDDGNPHDKTVVVLPLQEPVPPGGAIWVETDFRAKFPNPPIARTGAIDNYVFAGQWFPKIAVFEDGAWNCHQFHYNSEFYADFGVYDVAVTLPADWLFGATGVAVSRQEQADGKVRHLYHAEDVHDFAWTASPEYEVHQTTSQDVAIRLLLHRQHADQAERHLQASRDAVRFFQDLYGDYPFPNLTVVDPHPNASAVGGMEYPTLITAGTVAHLPAGVRLPEVVIIHEFGHNYWYHMVATNEFEASWLDEGINTYTEIVVLEALYGKAGNVIDFAGIQLNDDAMHRGQYLSLPDVDPILVNSWDYYSRGSYGINSYSRPGIVLWTLHQQVGADTMRAIMREYLRQFRFKHPKSGDFVQVVNEVSGQNWSPFFEQALTTRRVLDIAVDVVHSDPVEVPRGFDFGLDTTAANTEGAAVTNDEGGYDNLVKIRRLGDFIMPVEILFVYADGSEQRHVWDSRDPWVRYGNRSPLQLSHVIVDPDHKLPLDVNYTNNSKRLSPDAAPARHETTAWMMRLQMLLDVFGL